jgi:alpha-aminoadipate carrier protein LysW
MDPNSIECPDCGQAKALAGTPEIGQLITCPSCGALLELLSLTPPSAGKAPQVEEDFGE